MYTRANATVTTPRKYTRQAFAVTLANLKSSTANAIRIVKFNTFIVHQIKSHSNMEKHRHANDGAPINTLVGKYQSITKY